MDRPYPVVLLAGLALVTGTTMVAGGSVSGAVFSTYNPAWDGTSELRSLARETDIETDVARDPAYYQATDPEGVAVFVLSPESSYTPSEIAGMRAFVRQGGTVVVAGDFASSTNRLLSDLNVSVRLSGELLRDEERFDRGPTLPRATNVTRHPYTRGVNGLTLNRATTLRVADSNVTRLVNSSSFSYVDTNRNGQLDETETLQQHTVVSLSEIGQGRVLVVSDPSVFINAMVDRGGNRRFTRNLLGAHDRMAVDVSHSGGVPPVAWLVISIRESPFVQFAGGTLLVIGLATGGRIAAGVRARVDRRTRPSSDPPTFDREEVIESLRRRHPDWDDERLQRVAQNLIHREGNPQAGNVTND